MENKEDVVKNDEGSRLVLRLSDSFVFDGQEIKEIDMEGLVQLTAADMCAIDQLMIARGYSGTRMDTSRQYAMFVAARINNKPYEFCDKMKARDAIRLRDMVSAFFYARS